MSAAQVRDTMHDYVEALVARDDFARFFADDMELEVVGTDQRSTGAAPAEQTIRYLHEIAFDAHPELSNLLADEHAAALEATFVGTHIGEFAGIPATGAQVRVPYSVFYELAGDRITALRIYMSMEQLTAQVSAARAQATA